jgi:phosphatidylglycerol:prolipoprotein diacylglycerol transferase
MLKYPHVDPVLLQIGLFKIHWYGVMYLIGIGAGWALGYYRAKKSNGYWDPESIGDLIFYIAIGVVVGGRLGYMLFYDSSDFIHHPLVIVQIWDGGMSFHGGFIGVLIAMWLFARKVNRPWLRLADFIAPLVPIGLGAGRIGNFINGELWGRVTNVPWAMVFPGAGSLPRHPSQLYEFLLEGVLMFIVLWFYSSKPRYVGRVSALFLLMYGICRFLVEFFRNPDPQLGFVAFGWMTRGQELCVPMILLGVFLWCYAGVKGKNG